MRILAALLALLPALAAFAKPPEVAGYARMDELRQRMVARKDQLAEIEEFERKPRVEKLIILFKRGTPKTPDGKKLTGEFLLKEVFKWEPLLKVDPSPEALAILNQLPEAMRERYARVVPIPKRNRYAASKQLVLALNDDYIHFRKAAIESLFAIYADRKFYQPEMAPSKRKAKQKEWSRYIRDKSK